MKSRSDPVMFVILLIASTFSQGLTMLSYGKDFLTAFPENVAYFYPNTSSLSLRVTALYNDTTFTVHFNNTEKTSLSLMSGATAKVSFPKTAEVHQLGTSSNSIRITSDKDIVVHAFSQKGIGTATPGTESVQTHVVQPITNLGMNYLISPLNHSEIIQSFTSSSPDPWYQKNSFFKLIIINAEGSENNVKLVRTKSDSVPEEFKIPSYQLIQLQVDASLIKIESSKKVAVILTHPCLEITQCKCNMIVNQILPTQFQGQNFIVPFVSDITKSYLLMASYDIPTSLFYNKNEIQPGPLGFLSPVTEQVKPQYVNASGNVSFTLISPGFIIELIPENMFAACYLLQFYSGGGKALVIAETASKTDLRGQNIEVLPDAWYDIPDTKYSSIEITLREPTTVIWHPSSKIAVYILEKSGMTVYGGPAIPINEQPDEFGCVLIPGQYEVGSESLSWAESLAHCTKLEKHLASPTRENIQKVLSEKVKTADEEAWIGLRRSLMTTEWYWQRQTPSTTTSTTPPSPPPSVDYVHWADGHPDDKFKSLCASLSLKEKDEFKWKSAKCCEKKRPVCYTPAKCLNIPLTPPSPDFFSF